MTEAALTVADHDQIPRKLSQFKRDNIQATKLCVELRKEPANKGRYVGVYLGRAKVGTKEEVIKHFNQPPGQVALLPIFNIPRAYSKKRKPVLAL